MSTDVNRSTADLSKLIDERPLGRFQRGLLAICFILSIVEGFDTQIVAYAAPLLRVDLHLNPTQLGTVFSMAMVGNVVGYLVLGSLIDRFGRRWPAIASTATFGLFTYLSGQSSSFQELLVHRFAAGVGLAVCMASVLSLVVDYVPKRMAIRAVMMATTFYSVGFAGGSGIAAYIIPNYGWRVLFTIGGVAAGAMVIVLLARLPEAVAFMIRRPASAKTLPMIAERLAGHSFPPETTFIASHDVISKMPWLTLLADGRAFSTAMLWLVSLTNALLTFTLIQWIPSILTQAGVSVGLAQLSGLALMMGGFAGAAALASILGFFKQPFSLLAASYAVSAVSLVVLGHVIGQSLPFTVTAAALFASGFLVIGGQYLLNGLQATFYPPAARATGISIGYSFGRFGGVVGPFLTGMLMTARWTNEQIVASAAVPALIACLGAIAIIWIGKSAATMPHVIPAEAIAGRQSTTLS